eukprot:TRINITY_DN2901_c0_g3_i2.p1 TRINITY_DN2901_c0_g3~~TRINITY_DN2901_c0_g3_i2.p1  ORF type:complete len:386 (-),score=41.55 TRINITY_DN2901_c0_g3_i2:114-1271(-)
MGNNQAAERPVEAQAVLPEDAGGQLFVVEQPAAPLPAIRQPAQIPARISEIPPKLRILVLGGSRVGKSSLINALVNEGVSRDALQQPARTADSTFSNGTTDKFTAYHCENGHDVFDTIGLTDPRYTRKSVVDQLYRILFNFRIGVSLIVLVVKHDIFSNEEQDLVKLYEGILGENFYDHAMLVVTCYDNPVASQDDYRQRPHSPEFKSFLSRFPPGHIIVGSFQVDLDDSVDKRLTKRRQAFKNSIMTFLNQPQLREKTINLHIRGAKDVLAWIWARLKLPTNEQDLTLLHNAISSDPAGVLVMHDYECPICQEKVENDIYVNAVCQHVFHFDCIKVWIFSETTAKPPRTPTCPICRLEIQLMLCLNKPQLSSDEAEQEQEKLSM